MALELSESEFGSQFFLVFCAASMLPLIEFVSHSEYRAQSVE